MARFRFLGATRWLSALWLLAAAVSHPAEAQIATRHSSSNFFRGKPGEIRPSMITPQGVQSSETLVIDGLVDVIVQLKEVPLLSRRQAVSALGGALAAQALNDHHSRMLNEQQQVRGWIRGLEPMLPDREIRGFRFTFNGLAARVSQVTFRRLKEHPAVARVFRDVRMKATLDQSVPLIGAPQMWNDYGATGQGIRVAILDTGIDYTHPDLGHGFGPGQKVIGGYDFVNNDADPMDDHGHGTHVAGIVAANGTLKGVAPGAQLLAYKVLGADATGLTSGILAALERAADPDQNPLTDDKVHVVNMSLGGPGDADDPLSQAVDTAVDAGIVCVVAAGNRGSGYNTIDSPGCARKAITVGATDDFDQIAQFSSRGPGQPDLAIKPDLTAPGVAINSTKGGGGYESMDGTSMATPHVAGAVALLLQKHSGWSPGQIKGALIGSAMDLGLDPVTQGAGRLRIVEAHHAKGYFEPSSLSFGEIDTAGTWTRTCTAMIRNLSATPQTFDLRMGGNWPTSITWTLIPSQVTLGAGESRSVSVRADVAVDTLPHRAPPEFFSGRLEAVAGGSVTRVPVFLTRLRTLVVNFDVAPGALCLLQRNDPGPGTRPFIQYITNNGSPKQTSFRFTLDREGDFDLVVHGEETHEPSTVSNALLVHGGITITGNHTLSISLANVQSAVRTFVTKNENGAAVAIDPRSGHFVACVKSPEGIIVPFGWGGRLPSVAVSALPAGYRVDMTYSGWLRESIRPTHATYRYSVTSDGTSGTTIEPMAISRKPWILDPGGSDAYMHLNVIKLLDTNNVLGLMATSLPLHGVVGDPWIVPRASEVISLVSDPPVADFAIPGMRPVIERFTIDKGIHWGKVSLYGPWIQQDSHSIKLLYEYNQLDFLDRTGQPKLEIGMMPEVFNGECLWNEDGSKLTIFSVYGCWSPLFIGLNNESRPGEVGWEFWQGSSQIAQGSANRWSDDCAKDFSIDRVWQGEYTLKVFGMVHPVAGQPSRTEAILTFNTANADRKPPVLRSMDLTVDGRLAAKVEQGREISALLRLTDDQMVTAVEVWVGSEDAWTPQTVQFEPGTPATARVTFPVTLPAGFYGFKFRARDGAGNTLIQVFHAAFQVVQPGTLPTLQAHPVDTTVIVGQTATFSVTATGTAPLSYQWRKRGVAIPGATASSYTTPAVTTADHGATFSVVVRNTLGSVTSNEATLTVLAPVISLQPTAMGCFPGEIVALSASVSNLVDQRVAWSASAGTIDATGRYTAPGTPGLVTITASSVADPSCSATATITIRGTDFDGNTAARPRLLSFAHAMGSTEPADLAKYDFNGDGRIDDADLAKLFQRMEW